ncbi:MAG: hypothetical protein C4K60_11295 [Ideonella sp. MAG2]|nr:MAG: hypothetical protein C4K60_11295 [Ideonella sp. MAG2]
MDIATHPIQTCAHLFLSSLNEPQCNTLRLIVLEAGPCTLPNLTGVATSEQTDRSDPPVSGAIRVNHLSAHRSFELYWDSYVAYSVRNESYSERDPSADYVGQVLLRYSKSRFLDYVAQCTFANSDYPGPLTHWGVVCSEHIIDVVSTEEPVIRELKVESDAQSRPD